MKNLIAILCFSTCIVLFSNAILHAQFKFRFVQAATDLFVLQDTIDLLNGQNVAFERQGFASVLDLVDGDSFFPSRFAHDLNVLGTPGVDENDFAIEIAAAIEIVEPGTYTFGIALDDGGRLQIDRGNGFETVAERPTGGATGEFYGQVTFYNPGVYPFNIIYWDGSGQGNLEAYSAFGVFNSFDPSMRLLGDVANSGLKVVDTSLKADINCDGFVNFLDIFPFIGVLAGQ